MSVSAQDAAHYRHRDHIPVKRALISVSDKSGLLDLASALQEIGAEIVSTGSTAQTLIDAGIPVTPVEQVTGFPESLDGRVKTLHPAIHAGLLADLRLESHEQQLTELGFAGFQLVAVNLYPFSETVASGAEAQTVIENVDIGGPAMVRASAKNHANVAIVTSPSLYPLLLESLTQTQGTSLELRQQLAGFAFRHTAEYDSAVSDWFAKNLPSIDWVAGEAAGAATGAASAVSASPSSETQWKPEIAVTAQLKATLRYGENSHQPAALYSTGEAGIAAASQHGGKEMSYNNYVDADAALRAAYDFTEPAVAIIKHANPCGIAVADDIAAAHEAAHACDPVSAFGGVIAANRIITQAAAEQIAPIFTEVIVAPGYEPEALAVLQQKKNLRILQLQREPERQSGEAEVKQISGGLLAQLPDRIDAEGDNPETWKLVSGEAADGAMLADLAFAWRAVRAVKSNAILLAKNNASVGIGMGQVNRVDSCNLAVTRAGDRAAGSVAASDAFFPFADGPQILIDAGVSAIVQPGGSVRDEEVIAAAKAAGITMYFTGVRHFFH